VLLVGVDQLSACAHLASPEVFVAAYAPHSQVFTRAAAIVHHGGVGTLAQALRAGRPQLIVPFFADQLDNASRAQRLGVAMAVAPRKYGAKSAPTLLRRLLADPVMVARAAAVGKQVAGEDGAAVAARVILGRPGDLVVSNQTLRITDAAV
jgi:UDP:flavonoid glycosyltransferase YjiC (YdhE family)